MSRRQNIPPPSTLVNTRPSCSGTGLPLALDLYQLNISYQIKDQNMLRRLRSESGSTEQRVETGHRYNRPKSFAGEYIRDSRGTPSPDPLRCQGCYVTPSASQNLHGLHANRTASQDKSPEFPVSPSTPTDTSQGFYVSSNTPTDSSKGIPDTCDAVFGNSREFCFTPSVSSYELSMSETTLTPSSQGHSAHTTLTTANHTEQRNAYTALTSTSSSQENIPRSLTLTGSTIPRFDYILPSENSVEQQVMNPACSVQRSAAYTTLTHERCEDHRVPYSVKLDTSRGEPHVPYIVKLDTSRGEPHVPYTVKLDTSRGEPHVPYTVKLDTSRGEPHVPYTTLDLRSYNQQRSAYTVHNSSHPVGLLAPSTSSTSGVGSCNTCNHTHNYTHNNALHHTSNHTVHHTSNPTHNHILSYTPQQTREHTAYHYFTPNSTPHHIHNHTPNHTPNYTSDHTVHHTSNHTVHHTSNPTHNHILSYTPQQTREHTAYHYYTPNSTPHHIHNHTPNHTPNYTSDHTHNYTPHHTLNNTHNYSPQHTPNHSYNYTSDHTQNYTPHHIPNQTHNFMPHHTPNNTRNHYALNNTPQYTPIYTQYKTYTTSVTSGYNTPDYTHAPTRPNFESSSCKQHSLALNHRASHPVSQGSDRHFLHRDGGDRALGYLSAETPVSSKLTATPDQLARGQHPQTNSPR